MAKNAYAAELLRRKDERELIIKMWTLQMALDVFTLVLNDPAVMGKDVLGRKRLMAVGAEFNRMTAECMLALTGDPEADYIRIRMDEALVRILGPDAHPWTERYDGWTERNEYRKTR